VYLGPGLEYLLNFSKSIWLNGLPLGRAFGIRRLAREMYSDALAYGWLILLVLFYSLLLNACQVSGADRARP